MDASRPAAQPWDGVGLPTAAMDRLARSRAGTATTSLLSAAGVASIEAAGFEVVGDVLGCIGQRIGWQGFGGCGYTYRGRWSQLPRPTVVGSANSWAGFGPYLQAVRYGRATALQRMVSEAIALGADGVVGVRLRESRLGAVRDYVALGTAVRSRGRQRPATPFTTDLGGQDVAKLLAAGWVPVELVYGLTVAVRHDDYLTRRSVSRWAGNVEVGGYTELIRDTRAAVRRDIRREVARTGADSGLMSAMRMNVREAECASRGRDHIAEAIITGTAIARFGPGATASTSSLSILPLRTNRDN